MRLHMNGLESSSKPDCHAILARAHEQFKNGTMSQADFKQVQKQVRLLCFLPQNILAICKTLRFNTYTLAGVPDT